MSQPAPLWTPRRATVGQPLWAALRAADHPLNLDQLEAITARPRQLLRHQLHRWVQAGVASQTDLKPRGYSMIDRAAATLAPPVLTAAGIKVRQPTAVQRLWTAMRVLKRFDDVLLSMTADVPMSTTRAYLNRLKRAGYVEQTRLRGAKRGEPAVIVIRLNTGSRAPRVEARVIGGRSHRHLFDPNTNARIDISPGNVRLRGAK